MDDDTIDHAKDQAEHLDPDLAQLHATLSHEAQYLAHQLIEVTAPLKAFVDASNAISVTVPFSVFTGFASQVKRISSQVDALLSVAMMAAPASLSAFGKLEQSMQTLAEVSRKIAEAAEAEAEAATAPPPAKLNAFAGKKEVRIPSAWPFLTLVESTYNAGGDGQDWEHFPGQPPTYRRETKQMQTTVQLGRTSENQVFTESAISDLWSKLQTFKEEDVDLLLAILAQCIAFPDPAGTWLWAEQFLGEYRGVQPRMQVDEPGQMIKRSAGYRVEDLLEVERGISRLENLWIKIEEFTPPSRKGKKRRPYIHSGRVLSVMETWHQQSLDGTPGKPHAWRIKPGAWLEKYVTERHEVVFLAKKLFEYDPYREVWEKRLGRYFMFHLRINAKHGNSMIVRRVGLLLNDLSLPIDDKKNPQRTRDRFEKAMNRLRDDGQINDWQYKDREQVESALPAKKWLDQWLEWQVEVYAVAPYGRLQ